MLLFVKVNRFWAHMTLGLLLLVLGIRMLRGSPEQQTAASAPGMFRLLGEVLIGLVLGALAAVTGLMMNGLRLPILVRLLQGEVSVALGTNMAIGLLTALVGVVAAWAVGSAFDLFALLVVGPPTIVGIYLGAAVTGHLSKATLRRVLGWLIAVLGLLMMLEGFWRATRPRDLQPPPHTPAEVRELQQETDEWLDEPELAR